MSDADAVHRARQLAAAFNSEYDDSGRIEWHGANFRRLLDATGLEAPEGWELYHQSREQGMFWELHDATTREQIGFLLVRWEPIRAADEQPFAQVLTV